MYIYAVLIICHIIQFSQFFEEATIVSSFSHLRKLMHTRVKVTHGGSHILLMVESRFEPV